MRRVSKSKQKTAEKILSSNYSCIIVRHHVIIVLFLCNLSKRLLNLKMNWSVPRIKRPLGCKNVQKGLSSLPAKVFSFDDEWEVNQVKTYNGESRIKTKQKNKTNSESETTLSEQTSILTHPTFSSQLQCKKIKSISRFTSLTDVFLDLSD